MAWRGKLRSAGRKHNEQGVLRRRRENRTRRQDALLEPGPSPVPRAILDRFSKVSSPPHPTPVPVCPASLPGAQPGEWKVSWISAPTCPPSQVFSCRAQPAQPAALFHLGSASVLRCDLVQARPLPGPQSLHLIDMFFGALRPCSSGSSGVEPSLAQGTRLEPMALC